MPLGKAPVARRTLMLLLAVSDWRIEWRMRFPSNQSWVGRWRLCGRAEIFRPRLLVVCMIWMQRSSTEASERSAAVVSRFDWLPERVGWAVENRLTPSAPVYEPEKPL